MTIIESYKNGVPVIASDVGNVKEMVKDGINGLHFKAGDTESLIRTIEEFNKIDIFTLKENAYKEFENRYNQKVGYINTISVYNRVYDNG